MTLFDGERVAKVVNRIGWALLVGCGVLFWLRHSIGVDALAALAVVSGSLGFSMLGAVVYGLIPPSRLDDKEREHGYTTLAIRHDPEVALVLPRSGTIVRDRGEPAFAPKEYERLALAEIRSHRRVKTRT